MKILLFVPTYRKPDGELALYPRTRASLDALDHGQHEVTVWISVDESPNRRENIFAQYQRAWKRARAEQFDALLTIEHDMIVPADALVKLAEVDADIVYGVYLFRETASINAMQQHDDALLVAFLDNYPDERARAFDSRGPWPVSGAGFGCTLIRRSAFDTLALRVPLHGGKYPDLPLAYDASKTGLKQMAHFGVLCGHICPDGFVLWPAKDQITALTYTVPCRIKRSFRGFRNWRCQCSAGSVVQVPGWFAGKLANLGMLEILPRKEV